MSQTATGARRFFFPAGGNDDTAIAGRTLKLTQGEAAFGFHVLAAVDAVEFDVAHSGVGVVE